MRHFLARLAVSFCKALVLGFIVGVFGVFIGSIAYRWWVLGANP